MSIVNKVKNFFGNFKEKLMKNKFTRKILEIYEKLSKNTWVTYVAFLYILAFACFGYTLIRNNFVMPMSGDYIMQQIPFYYNGYDDLWTALKTGKLPLWDEQQMLGVSNVGANSFYYLFNIFFLPVLLFPRSLVPQAQAFMIMTKIVLAGVGMRLLLKKFNVSLKTNLIVSTAYAFCGWNFYYLWFNHFFEMAVLMPFFLLSIEQCLRDKKMIPLIFMVFISGVTNYNYLIAMCFTGVMYAVFRYFQRIKDMKEMNQEERRKGKLIKVHVAIEIILKGIASFAIGLILTAVILVPCFMVAKTNSRVETATYLPRLVESLKSIIDLKDGGDLVEEFKSFINLLIKWEDSNGAVENLAKKWRLYPLVSFFFPNVSYFDSTLFLNEGYDDVLSSLNVYTPLTLMLVPSIYLSIREKKFSHLIAFLGVIAMLFTPFVYYCFSGFTNEGYGRWQLFVVAIYCIYVAIQLDKKDKLPRWIFDISFVFVLLTQIFVFIQANKLGGATGTGTKVLDDERKLIAYLSMVGTGILYLFYRLQLKKNTFYDNLKFLLMIEVVIVGNCNLQMCGNNNYATSLYGGKDNVSTEVALASRIKENDDSYYRVFSTTSDRTGVNFAMTLGVRGLATFHSVFNYNLNEFMKWSQVKYHYSDSSWNMGIHEKRVYLDQFLGTKYYIVKNSDTNIPFGFEEYFSTDTHSVYINTNFVDLGTSYTTLYTKPNESTATSAKVFINEMAYLNGAILSDEYIATLLDENTNFINKGSLRNDKDLTSKFSSSTGKLYVQRKENNALQPEVEIGSDRTPLKGLKRGSVVTEVFTNNVCNKATPSNPCYVDVNARLGENLKISFYDENDKLLVSDTHLVHGFGSKSSATKNNRGFYVTAPVKKIIINVNDNFDDNSYILTPSVQYQHYDEYLTFVNKNKENAVKNVKVINSDEITFETDYEENRIVVLNIPYDSGWSIVDQNKEGLPIYKAQGGFISFVATAGDNSYYLSYETPYLRAGLKITYFGTIITTICFVTLNYLEERKKYNNYLFLR